MQTRETGIFESASDGEEFTLRKVVNKMVVLESERRRETDLNGGR